MQKIAIIGAGMAGTTLATYLRKDQQVTIFEKARSVGGRMSNRRAANYSFDHGAQFFSAKSKEFQEFLQPLIQLGIVKSWNIVFCEFKNDQLVRRTFWDNTYPHYIALPAMNGLVKYLAKDLDIRLNCAVQRVEKKPGQVAWQLFDQNEQVLGEFDWVISSAPPEQTINLLPESFQYQNALKQIKMSACYSLLLGFAQPLKLQFEAALVKEADISWISVNNSKYGRTGGQALLVHSTNQWADQHLLAEENFVLKYLLAETKRVTKQPVEQAIYQAIHKWRYANIARQKTQDYFIDINNQLGALGDWCIQGRVEAAFLSAKAAAQRMNILLN